MSPRPATPPAVTVTGAAQATEKAKRELLLHSAIAAVGIMLLLTVVFHNARNLLLVLDNFEHLPGASRLLPGLLERCPNSRKYRLPGL